MTSFTAIAQNWESSYDDALANAAKTEKSLLIVFAGSDWCAPCIKLDREIWSSEDFIAYAKENYVLYRADFPRKKKNELAAEVATANRQLADKFNPDGYFPLVILLDSEERVLGKTSYKKVTPKEYISHLNAFLK